MRIYVKVTPRSGKNKVEKVSEGNYRAWVSAPPVSGRANEALIEVLAGYFQISRSRMKIAGGKTARTKIVDIE